MPIKAVDLRRYYTVGGTTVKALDGVSLDLSLIHISEPTRPY